MNAWMAWTCSQRRLYIGSHTSEIPIWRRVLCAVYFQLSSFCTVPTLPSVPRRSKLGRFTASAFLSLARKFTETGDAVRKFTEDNRPTAQHVNLGYRTNMPGPLKTKSRLGPGGVDQSDSVADIFT